jgi:hypothetical protein
MMTTPPGRAGRRRRLAAPRRLDGTRTFAMAG